MTQRRSWADIEAEANLDFDPRSTTEYQKAVWGPQLGALLRTARTDAKASQSELARDMQTTQSNIARLESGANLPTIETLARVAKAVDKNLVIGIVSDDEFKGSSMEELGQNGRVIYGRRLQRDYPFPVDESVHGVGDYIFPADSEGSDVTATDLETNELDEDSSIDELSGWIVERDSRRRDLALAIADHTGQDAASVTTAVRGLAEVVAEAVAKGWAVAIPDFVKVAQVTPESNRQLRKKMTGMTKAKRSAMPLVLPLGELKEAVSASKSRYEKATRRTKHSTAGSGTRGSADPSRDQTAAT
jgi:transcriptional regulator with XRE-family HTH domain